MFKDEKYSVKMDDITYARERGLSQLIHEGYNRMIHEAELKPRYMCFKGENIEFKVDSNHVSGIRYLDPDEILSISLFHERETSQKLREKMIQYILGYHRSLEKDKEFQPDVHIFVYQDHESPPLCGLNIGWYENRAQIFRRKDMSELEQLLSAYMDLLEVEGLTLKQKRSKNSLFVTKEGKYATIGLNRRAIINVNDKLLKDAKVFAFYISTSPRMFSLAHLLLNERGQELSFFLNADPKFLLDHDKFDLFKGLQDLLPDRVQFREIEYDTLEKRQDEKMYLAREQLRDEVIRRFRNEGRETSRKEIQTKLQKLLFPILREGRSVKEARDNAKFRAEWYSKYLLI